MVLEVGTATIFRVLGGGAQGGLLGASNFLFLSMSTNHMDVLTFWKPI